MQKFSPKVEFISIRQTPQTDKGKPKGMCRDKDGNIVVLEPHYSRINHFTPAGALVAQWRTHGTTTAELAFPRSVAVNSRGEILVSEYGLTERVQCFALDGALSPTRPTKTSARGSAGTPHPTFVRAIGKAGDGVGEFNRAEGLGIDAQDRIYVADSCNHRIQMFSPYGEFLTTFGRAGAAPGDFSYPYDVRIDAQGFQYVCEFGNSRIQIFDPQHRFVEMLGGPGAAPGKMSNPWAIALDSRGNLYVADAGNHRVLKFVRRQNVTALPNTRPRFGLRWWQSEASTPLWIHGPFEPNRQFNTIARRNQSGVAASLCHRNPYKTSRFRSAEWHAAVPQVGNLPAL